MKQDIIATRRYREKMLADPYRPGYHFVVPDDNGLPGDPNGAFFADGRYHLMYLYRNSANDSFHWGHVSSIDLLHWRHHPDALTALPSDQGCYSGGAFVDADGTAYLSFWKMCTLGTDDDSAIVLAWSRPPYDHWQRMETVAVESVEWGITERTVDSGTEPVGCADPSNIWKLGEYYYMQTGNLLILNKYGRKPDSDPKYQGDWTDLFRSRDLKTWEYVHRFYDSSHLGENRPDRTEDDMCPSFLPLADRQSGGSFTDKWLQLFIAHNKGCQYYVGTLENETFYPEVHGRMSWKDNAFFAPEALVDDKNRQIMWAWLQDTPKDDFARFGWSGVYSLPRCLWWQDGQLHMAPAEELERLQYNHQSFAVTEGAVPVKNGQSFRLKAKLRVPAGETAGIRVKASAAGDVYTDILADTAAGKLIMDTTRGNVEGRPLREEAPFVLQDGEMLELDIFVDKCVVEVFANNRQAICRQVFPANPADAAGVQILGGAAETLDAWEMMPCNPY